MTITTATTAAKAGAPPGHTGSGAAHLARLATIEGQTCGLARMIEDDRYCTDVLTQISAITRALQEVALGLLDDHMRHCVTGAARLGPHEADQKLAELTIAFRRLLRT